MPHYKLKRRGARPRKCLRVKKTSFEPESNQRPKDCQLATYSPPLYQLSYRRQTGRGQNLNPPGFGALTAAAGFDSRSGNELLPSSGGRDCKMPHYKLKRRGARPRKCLRVKKTSFEPESNQRPKDCQLATYSPPLYQLSYRRHTGRGQNLNPPGR
ncbi:unnamed protein product [Leuciscus chuanchicus]